MPPFPCRLLRYTSYPPFPPSILCLTPPHAPFTPLRSCPSSTPLHSVPSRRGEVTEERRNRAPKGREEEWKDDTTGGEVWKERDKGPDWSTERNEDRNRTVQHSSRRRSLARVSCCPYRSSLPRSLSLVSRSATRYARHASRLSEGNGME